MNDDAFEETAKHKHSTRKRAAEKPLQISSDEDNADDDDDLEGGKKSKTDDPGPWANTRQRKHGESKG